MAFFKEELATVKAFVFDVDGVLSKDTSALNEDGDPVRTANVKDGFAIRNALRNGFPIAIITGGEIERVKLRYQKLGVKYYYDSVHDKTECLMDFCTKEEIKPESVLFMGDDLVDLDVMQHVGVPTCPLDAVPEIKKVSKYISDKKGGKGCVRDVIEQVMKAQEKWINPETFKRRAF